MQGDARSHGLWEQTAPAAPVSGGLSGDLRADVVVIGAGAAGLMCAQQAGYRGRSVLLLDNAKKPGRKILISGGGRCNFTNHQAGPHAFLSGNPHFCKSALARYRPEHFIAMVDAHGIAWHEKELGQLFCDDSSKQIVAMLLAECNDAGVAIDTSGQGANPAAQAFQATAGQFGLRIFGLILWAAAITSVIGAAYTSMSFISVFKPNITEQGRNRATTIFIAVSLLTYLMMGTAPAALLLFAGGFNGLILPIGLSLFIYVGWCRSDMMGGYHYPRWLLVLGALTCLLTWYMAIKSIGPIFAFLNVV